MLYVDDAADKEQDGLKSAFFERVWAMKDCTAHPSLIIVVFVYCHFGVSERKPRSAPRAKNFLMLCVLRRIGAISPTGGLRPALRRLSSERRRAPDDKKKKEIGTTGPQQLYEDELRHWRL